MTAAGKLKVAVLYDVWEDEAETPDPEPEKPARKAKAKKKRQRKEKHDREEIFEAIEKLGHEPFYQRGIKRAKPGNGAHAAVCQSYRSTRPGCRGSTGCDQGQSECRRPGSDHDPAP